MDTIFENNSQTGYRIWGTAEVILLLLLPLPFLNLKLLYLVAALAITLSSKYIRKEKWTEIGFKKVNTTRVFAAIAIGIGYGFAGNYLLEPLITKLVGAEPDLSVYKGVQGNLSGLIGMLLLGWVVGGLFEEYFFRGYLYNRIRTLISHPVLYKWVAVLVTSVVFAFAHNYQGIGGIVDTFIFAVVMGLLYFRMGRNVWYLVLIHGFYDMVGIFRLYLGAYDARSVTHPLIFAIHRCLFPETVRITDFYS
jgi:membrane protease YdiL (CAAX protease family)